MTNQPEPHKGKQYPSGRGSCFGVTSFVMFLCIIVYVLNVCCLLYDLFVFGAFN